MTEHEPPGEIFRQVAGSKEKRYIAKGVLSDAGNGPVSPPVGDVNIFLEISERLKLARESQPPHGSTHAEKALFFEKLLSGPVTPDFGLHKTATELEELVAMSDEATVANLLGSIANFGAQSE